MKYWRLAKEQMRITGRASKNNHPMRGTAGTELALLLPLLVLMFLGTIDFARLWYASIEVANAARAGVQYGAQNASKSADTNGMIQAATNDAGDVSGLSVTAQRNCTCSNGSAVDCTNANCGILDPGPNVYVTVRAQKAFQTLFPYPGIPHTVQLSQQAVMRAR